MTNEQLRTEWSTAVADANQLSDMLDEATNADEPDDELVLELTENLTKAQDLADVAYKAYLKATANWVTEAPWRFDALVVSSTVHNPETETIAPSITFAFRAQNVEPITVTLVMTELNLRKFQANLGKQIDKSIKSCRELARG
jgi:hypothetical protein